MSTERFNLPNNLPFPHDDNNESQSFADLMSHFQNGGEDLEHILQNERPNLVVDDSIKNDVRLTPSEINILTHDVINNDWLSLLSSCGNGKLFGKLNRSVDI
jgi:hypothetical protein